MPLKKEKKWVPDPEMQQILQVSVDAHQVIVNRTKEYLRVEEMKLDKAKKRLADYNSGKLYK